MMNRILTQILAAMMALNLVACGQPAMSNNAPENTEAVVEEIDIEEAKDMAAATLPGGWRQAEDPQITEEMNEVFEKALEGLLGVNYSPVALVSEQVVNGKNYCFLSEATVVYPGAEAGYSLVYINVDAEGKISLNEIVSLNAAEAVAE